jgi:hypothetical protein
MPGWRRPRIGDAFVWLDIYDSARVAVAAVTLSLSWAPGNPTIPTNPHYAEALIPVSRRVTGSKVLALPGQE